MGIKATEVVNVTVNTVNSVNGATSHEVGFLPHPTKEGAFAPLIEGIVLVKAPSLKDNVLVGSLVPYFTTCDERTALKAIRALRTGRWAPVAGLLTKGNVFRKDFEALAAKASDGLKAAREGRVEALDEAKKVAKAAKAAVKAEAKVEKAPKAKKAKAKTVEAAAPTGDANLMRYLAEQASVISHMTAVFPMSALTVSMAYGVPLAIVEELAAQIAAAAEAAA
jgi:hypothetical protein